MTNGKIIRLSETPRNLLPGFQRIYTTGGVYLNRRKQERKRVTRDFKRGLKVVEHQQPADHN